MMLGRLLIILSLCALLFLMAHVAMSQSASPAPSAQPPSSQPEATASPANYSLREGLKTMADGSSTLVGWGLTIIGASIAIIVSTSYFRPTNQRTRMIYLLFIPGWVSISLSIYYGNRISRDYIAAALVPRNDVVRDIGNSINDEFGLQLLFLQLGLLCFSIWLLLFLLWWVFGDWLLSNNKSKKRGE